MTEKEEATVRPLSALPPLRAVATGSQKRRGGIRWDEANLEANEGIKRDLNPQKILEPKTPYLSPMETDDELDMDGAGMSPLKLDDEGPSANGSTAGGHGWEDGVRRLPAGLGPAPSCSSNWSDSDRSVGRSPRVAGRSPRFSVDDPWDVARDGDVESADPERQEKRRRFREARRQHYKMRASLKQGAEEPEGADEDEEGPLAPAPSAVDGLEATGTD
ncbi:hypothetical protein ACKKBF_B04245 [Auxenochlorella protothecoides x Auxenochlorella symbiontica]